MARSQTPNLAHAYKLHRAGRLQQAETAYRTILTRKPNHLDTIIRYAQLLRETGRAPQAIPLLQNARRQHPEHPALNLELGQSFLAINRPDEAVRILQPIASSHPGMPLIQAALGKAYFALGQTRPAVAALMRADQQHPNDSDTLLMLSTALMKLGQLGRAVGYLNNAHRVNPDSPEIRKQLGRALFYEGRLDEAEPLLRELVEDPGGDPAPDAIAFLSELLESRGRLDEAASLLDRELDHGNNHPVLAITRAKLHRRNNNPDKALELLTPLREATDLPDGLRAFVLFELASIYEKTEKYDLSFTLYEEANSLLHYQYNAKNQERFVDALIEHYSRSSLAHLPRAESSTELPIFIVGMPRSGTTLVEQIIASHSLIYGAGELPNIGRAVESLTRINDSSNRTKSPRPAGIENLSPQNLSRMASEYLDDLQKRAPNAKRITDKMPENFFHIGFISQMLPGARVFHCRRNAVDNAISLFATPLGPAHTYSTNLKSIAHYYRQYQRLMDHWRSIIDDLDVSITEIRYESVIDDPERHIRQLIRSCNLDWEDQCLNFHESKRSIATASVSQVRRPIYRSSLKRYEHFESHLAPLIEALGDISS